MFYIYFCLLICIVLTLLLLIMRAVCFFLFLFLLFVCVSSDSPSPSPSIQFGGLRGQAAVTLEAEWKSNNEAGPYTSKLYYKFCAVLPQSARIMLGNLSKLRFIQYTDYKTTSVKYDQIHPLPNVEIDSVTGCMQGQVTIHQPFEIKTPSDSFVLLLLI